MGKKYCESCGFSGEIWRFRSVKIGSSTVYSCPLCNVSLKFEMKDGIYGELKSVDEIK